MLRAAFAICISVSLAACASPRSEYPSLAIRDAERISGTAQVVMPTPQPIPTTLSQSTATRLEQLSGKVMNLSVQFDQANLATARLVAAARGQGITTKANASAQVALADLQSQHADLLSVAAELDVMSAEAILEGTAREPIIALKGRVDELVESQRESLTVHALALRSR